MSDDPYGWVAEEHRCHRLARLTLMRFPEIKNPRNEDDLAATISGAIDGWLARRKLANPNPYRGDNV